MARRAALRRAAGWPDLSPGAVNAWLLLVTTKSPSWRDRLLLWPAGPPTLGTPHEGFFYPDPLGFWTEVRRWATILLRVAAPGWSTTDALSLTALIHSNEDVARVALATEICQPVVTLYLDETARVAAGVTRPEALVTIPDPHRPSTVYEGWWSRTPDGAIVGKAPQHPASHLLFRQQDMDRFLGAVPIT